MQHFLIHRGRYVILMLVLVSSVGFVVINRRPVLSWGVPLPNAENVRTVAVHPWPITPVLFVIAAVPRFSFVGGGLRDAADPSKR